jgi:hypothetical protein
LTREKSVLRTAFASELNSIDELLAFRLRLLSMDQPVVNHHTFALTALTPIFDAYLSKLGLLTRAEASLIVAAYLNIKDRLLILNDMHLGDSKTVSHLEKSNPVHVPMIEGVTGILEQLRERITRARTAIDASAHDDIPQPLTFYNYIRQLWASA